MIRRSTFLKSLVLLFALLASCTNTMTNKAIVYGDNLKASIERFEEQRRKISGNIDKSIDTIKDITTENTKTEDISNDWEVKWNRIETEFKNLEVSFASVEANSKAYFSQLNKLSTGIVDKKLKTDELMKNMKLKIKWNKTHKEAKVTILKLKVILKNAQDIKRVLIASTIRKKIFNNITELQSISTNTKKLIRDLEKFTIECKEIIS